MSVNINTVCLTGNLVRDADLTFTGGGTPICKFSIALNRRRKNGEQWEDEANFFDIVLWGKQAETLNQYLLKGKPVAISGELRQERWTTQDGQTRSRVEVVADQVQLLGNNNSGGGHNNPGSVTRQEVSENRASYNPGNGRQAAW